MSNGIEIEVKFDAKSATDLLRLPQNLKTLGWDLSDPNDVVMNDYYLDTPDLDLLQSGWTIRLRRASEQSKITLHDAGQYRIPQQSLTDLGVLFAGSWVEGEHILADAAVASGRLAGRSISSVES